MTLFATKNLLALTLLSLTLASHFAEAQGGGSVSAEWDSKDISYKEKTLKPGENFYWINQDTGKLEEKTAGPNGATVIITDDKRKKGKGSVAVTALSKLGDATYGMNGEPPVPFNGQITEGTGNFTLSFIGFTGIDDVIDAPFTASLVSNGNDNPFSFALYGQGDQLQTPKSGKVSYMTKWQSYDDIMLSDGSYFDIGDFFLTSSGDPTAFNYELGIDLIGTGSFTIGEDYFFVKDFADGMVESNIRLGLTGGEVTKNFSFHTVSEPNVLPLALLATGLAILRTRRKERVVNNSSSDLRRATLQAHFRVANA